MSEGCRPQRLGTVTSTGQHAIGGGSRTCFAVAFLLTAFPGATASCLAQDATQKADPNLAEVVIQAKRQAVDEQITLQVEKTLTDDPWVYSEHLTVTTRNGVVRIEGIVQDTAELFRILRLARKTPGARRVVNATEMLHNDPDGG
jgi:hypothetical protein